MRTLPRKIDFLEMEEKWERLWEENCTHRYHWDDDTRPRYSIDTPPPYPSGDFHMGNVLNWTYFDMRARYKRMRGYNVHFPQGWDCHGLPTEVSVEKAHKIRRSDVPPDEFRKLCEEWIEEYIAIMKEAVIRLGCSVDWSLEYRTMEPEYIRRVQLSFLMLYDKDMIYKGEHPINWCPRCETAIADAEVEREQKTGRMYTIAFSVDGEDLLIATTRPEYIPACVAVGVHPDDERFNELFGKDATLPLTGRKVPIIADDAVDTTFGTGTMMICTYGDKADVLAVAKYKLPVIKLIDGKGLMTATAGSYEGMSVVEARDAIIKDLDEAGLLRKTESLEQEIGICWRCKRAIEVLTTDQWFMRTMSQTEEVVKTTMEIDWFPDWMRYRLVDWATSLDWDWVLSRQRVFATPIPVWYCESCGRIRPAKPEELPVDPRVIELNDTCECGGTAWRPETDVFDTWFDSSLTCSIHAGWPVRDDWRNLFPASVHPSGQDIIRTWAYYLMVRHLALFGETAYDSVLINGMVLGSDGRKMSKSLGNYVASQDVFDKYGADAARQWAATGGSTGTDIPFRWQDVEYGWRFMRKLWNACRFASMRLGDYDPGRKVEPELLDRWIMCKLERVLKTATEEYENCNFMNAAEAARNFVWHTFCDHYLEAVKHRLYSEGDEKASAQATLNYVVERFTKLLAPVMPHVTEEIFSTMYASDGDDSIHLSAWPEANDALIDDEVEGRGDLIIAVIRDIRREKNRLGIPLNTPLEGLTIYAEGESSETITLGLEDISATIKADEIEVIQKKAGQFEVEGYPGVRFDFDTSDQ
ncbi:MAG: valine--tRNA ligase [Candidatus Bathyarchaeota archaeon]|nr:MAG: valine--tRNA ligase [Candidatus Bathyarchaeota archaeon]